MLESILESHAVGKIRMVGGRAFKWVCPGMGGAPDRICVFPGGRIVFVEFKRPGRKDGRSERQKKMFRLLESLGCDVRLISDVEELDAMLEEVVRGDV